MLAKSSSDDWVIIPLCKNCAGISREVNPVTRKGVVHQPIYQVEQTARAEENSLSLLQRLRIHMGNLRARSAASEMFLLSSK